MPPEVERCKKFYGDLADVFSLGVILFMMVTCKPIFGDFPYYDKRYLYCRKNSNIFWKHFNVSPNFRDLIVKMIALKRKRITLDEVINHPWL